MSDVKLVGRWKSELFDENGNLKKVVQGKNVVCTNGKEFLASFLYSACITASTFTMKYIGIGSDSTTEAAANTALGTELARHTATVSYVSNRIYQAIATFGTGVGTGNVYEYGLFSSSTAGTMLCRDTESLISKGANDVLVVTSQITIE